MEQRKDKTLLLEEKEGKERKEHENRVERDKANETYKLELEAAKDEANKRVKEESRMAQMAEDLEATKQAQTINQPQRQRKERSSRS